MALVAVAVALGLVVFAGMPNPDPEGTPVHEEQAAVEMIEPGWLVDPDSDDRPVGLLDYSNCASMIGCYEPGSLERRAWEQEKLEMLERGEELVEPASNCIGFCFNAVVESVDDENWRIANVVIVGEKGKTTPAIVERTRIWPSSRGPASEGQPVRFACYDRVLGEDGLRFESCSQMAVLE